MQDITAYCDHGTMADGNWTHTGAVASLSRHLRFGTHVRIEGLGTFVIEDRIGHGSDFDIWFPTCSEARQFGRKHRRVYLVP